MRLNARPASNAPNAPTQSSHRGRQGNGERGSALALVPAGFLVLIILSAITVDSAVAFLGQRQLGDALAAAANDAAAAAVADGSFYGAGQITIDPRTAANVVCESVRAQEPNLQNIQMSLAVDGPAIAVRGTAQVREIFGRALPGLHARQVSASASAQVEGAPEQPGPSPTSFVPILC